MKQEVLKAEVAIRQLVEDMVRAKKVADSVEEIRKRLERAAEILEKERSTIEDTLPILKELAETTQFNEENLNKTIKDMFSKILRETSDISQKVENSFNKTTKSFEEMGQRVDKIIENTGFRVIQNIVEASKETQKVLSQALDLVTDLRITVQNHINLSTKNYENLQAIVNQESMILKRTFKLVLVSLIFSILGVAGVVAFIVFQYFK